MRRRPSDAPHGLRSIPLGPRCDGSTPFGAALRRSCGTSTGCTPADVPQPPDVPRLRRPGICRGAMALWSSRSGACAPPSLRTVLSPRLAAEHRLAPRRPRNIHSLYTGRCSARAQPRPAGTRSGGRAEHPLAPHRAMLRTGLTPSRWCPAAAVVRNIHSLHTGRCSAPSQGHPAGAPLRWSRGTFSQADARGKITIPPLQPRPSPPPGQPGKIGALGATGASPTPTNRARSVSPPPGRGRSGRLVRPRFPQAGAVSFPRPGRSASPGRGGQLGRAKTPPAVPG